MTLGLGDTWRSLRRRLKEQLPYVRRRQLRVLNHKYVELTQALARGLTPAAAARIEVRKPVQVAPDQELCLFVSFGARPVLRPHVLEHIRHLRRQGIQVVLVINTDLPLADIQLDTAVLDELAGACVRQNLGFDFAAWAHAIALAPAIMGVPRLYLTNDSIVGPLDAAAFDTLIGRIRASRADVVGLTECLAPTRHLQSFFLVFTQRALAHAAVQRLWQGMVNLHDKGQVIDVYECNVTRHLCDQGLTCEAMFPSLTNDRYNSNDVGLRWQALLDQGFPYIKTSVIRSHEQHPHIRSLVPAAVREAL